MGHSYLRHGPTQAFGLVCSSSSNSFYSKKLAYVPALEDVLVWDMKKGQMLAMWHETGHSAEVTCIIDAPQNTLFAVGYADGSIRLWDSTTGSVTATFSGHSKAITALAFDERGTRLASGSQDTDLIIWDVVAESGLHRLRGHRDQITSIRFISESELPSTSGGSLSHALLTTSKDTLMKLWDLSTQHCVQTVVAHRSGIWAMDVDLEQNLVFTGSSDGELKVWKLSLASLSQGLTDAESGEINKAILPFADLPLSSRHRVSQVTLHPSQPYLAVQSHDRSVEIFRIRTEEEVKKKQARRIKRQKEKKQRVQNAGEAEENPIDTEQEVKLLDIVVPHIVVRATAKIRSFAFDINQGGTKGGLHLLTALASNSLEVYAIPLSTKSEDDAADASKVFSVDIPGHRSNVRTMCLSSDDQLLASGSNGLLKIWNMKSTACIRTMACGDAIWTKAGEIMIFDIASSSLINTIKAHEGSVWSLHVRPDEQVLVSGGADKDVKFWDFAHEEGSDNKVPTLIHARTLKMSDEVLSVKYSPSGKLLAVSLLDSTVKIFYQDTLKFFLSLYGHKLPVLSMDISDDSKLIVTCSADKNVKIWGLEFGDCHKSIFAHDDSIMQVAFEKRSHYFWTVGKDKMLKYWDGDKFANIQTLRGHHGEIWALALSHRGNFVVTGSHDKSIRVWEKLDEPLFLEEERERELELMYEKELPDQLHGNENGKHGEDQPEVTQVTKQTTETLMAGERILEAIDLADQETAVFQEYEEQKARVGTLEAAGLLPPPRNPVLAAYDVEPEAYVLKVVEKVPTTALHDALLVIPFNKVISLMKYLSVWAQKGWNIILVSRILFFLLRVHHHQIVSNRVMRTALVPLRLHLRAELRRQKDIIGYNLSALQFIQRKTETERMTQFYEREGFDQDIAQAKIEEGKKRKRVNITT
ncbi:hypothetical protein SERLA73DRAFT_166331 [Serpula lacrymans var. lacrymans S7.3]|uniref:Small-subunit processome Utp12 domain-containing protein n=1 Tax=Serpula lacrymans var. lacrymans (strain S7.3) TaxID=936435 RepID=F8PNT9_SERL3|nr:hypothetical protein SERLA73DRAFT_166331 [Serpula lacrymans var. lacrymans S7.3]